MRVLTDSYMSSSSGIGVIQRQLYPRLQERNVSFEYLARRDGHRRNAQRGAALLRGLSARSPACDVHLAMSSPFPLAPATPVVPFVYDLRWRWTRSKTALRYRRWDLERCAAGSAMLLTISERSRDDLLEYLGARCPPVHVVHLGPGLMGELHEPTGRVQGRVLLVGGAPHKRNELFALAASITRPAWLQEVVGVNLSIRCRSILEDILGPRRCTWLSNVNDEVMERCYRTAETFVCLSLSEGFGLPYIEAVFGGAKVVAIDQALTRELLDASSCLLLRDGSPSEIAAQLALDVHGQTEASPSEAWIARFSWDRAAAEVLEALTTATVSTSR